MAIALFDLDNTLLHGDSDYLWGEFLIAQGAVDGATYHRENRRYFEAYKAGKLDIRAFLAFSLAPLARYDATRLVAWRQQFMAEKIAPIMLPKARELLDEHRRRGDTLVIITATNRFVTEPIAAAFNVPHLIATEVELDPDGQFTGRPLGIPCFQGGKVERLENWLHQAGADLKGSYFYSDSRNDLPLLERVEHAFAVDPDEHLAEVARQRGWPIINLAPQDNGQGAIIG